jgi:hypothetical protein
MRRFLLSVLSILPMARRLTDRFCWMNLCISLPLAIWLSSGWIGLLNHWQVICGVASLVGNSGLSPRRAYKTTPAIWEIPEGLDD